MARLQRLNDQLLTTNDYPFFSTTAIDSSSASMATSASSLVTMSGGAMRTGLGPQLHDAITLAGAVLASLLVFHDLDADHQATSADVSDDLVLLRPVGHAFQHVGADFLRIL